MSVSGMASVVRGGTAASTSPQLGNLDCVVVRRNMTGAADTRNKDWKATAVAKWALHPRGVPCRPFVARTARIHGIC